MNPNILKAGFSSSDKIYLECKKMQNYYVKVWQRKIAQHTELEWIFVGLKCCVRENESDVV